MTTKTAANNLPPELIEAARRLLAEADEAKVPDVVAPEWEEPILVHVLTTSFALSPERNPTRWRRGAEILVTPDMVTNRLWTRDGRNVFEEFLDERGAGKVERGPFPPYLRPWRYGDARWYDERRAADNKARSLLNAEDREAARDEVRRVYGPGGTSPADYEAWYETQYHVRRAWEVEQAEAASAGIDR